ncbi:MAG: HAMP domain-containing sensor histidine kinase [Rudaea sp.]
MSTRSGIRRKIWTVYILQVAAISLATILGVYAAATVLEDVLIKHALIGEADFFWNSVHNNALTPVPVTANMTGYLVPDGAEKTTLPEPLRTLEPGYHRIQHAGTMLVMVSDGPSGRLYLVFNQEQVARLAFMFGFVPLILVLVIIYITTWLTYRASRSALSPVITLAKVVRDWNPKHPDLAALDPQNLAVEFDGDVETLARALHAFATRIEEFVDRERNFTRDASHELRSPLTVIKVAADVLQEEELSEFSARAVQRIRRSVRDMEATIEAFLLLARESDTGLAEEDFLVNEAVREEIERAQPLIANKPVNLDLTEHATLLLHAPPKVVASMIGNLIRNACLYTEAGDVKVDIGADYVRVQDSGIGMSAEDLGKAFEPYFRGGNTKRGGYGVGLSLVRRLSDRFGWPVEMNSELGVGTTATIRFPQAMISRHALT